jgi:hypothetical protein
MKELEICKQEFVELQQTELRELRGGNPIIDFVWGVLRGWAWDYIFSPTQGSQTSHVSAPRNSDGTYICVSDNA